jgi:hypothetical protein
MSRIIANNIRHNDATSDNITLDGSGNVSAPGNLTLTGSLTANGIAYPTAGPLSNRNLIINGAMQVAQRGTSVATSNNNNEGYQTVDRYYMNYGSGAGGAATVSQSTTVPDGQGFSNSLKIDVTTSHTPTTSQRTEIRYHVEAQDIRNSGWNYTDSESYITLSFWARSVKAGTYCLWLILNDSSPTQYYIHEYSLTANTWEKITVPIPGVSGAAIDNDNGKGFSIYWILNVGPDRDGGTAGSWFTTANVIATDNQVNFFDSTDNDFYLTGVQLEVGSVATPFEHRSFDDELRRCQRYYQTSFPYGDAIAANSNYREVHVGGQKGNNLRPVGYVPFNTKMRATPSVTVWNNHRDVTGSDNAMTWYNSSNDWQSATSFSANIDMAGFSFAPDSGGGSSYAFYFNWEASAEL